MQTKFLSIETFFPEAFIIRAWKLVRCFQLPTGFRLKRTVRDPNAFFLRRCRPPILGRAATLPDALSRSGASLGGEIHDAARRDDLERVDSKGIFRASGLVSSHRRRDSVKLIVANSFIAIAVLLVGCQTHLTGGTVISSETMNTLAKGMTYQEVVAELGPPLLYLDGERVIAYPWTTDRGSGSVLHFGWQSPDQDLGYYEIHPIWHAFCLKFDSQKNLEDWKYIQASSQEAYHKEIHTWTDARPGATSVSNDGVH
jgi:hypothetical protein